MALQMSSPILIVITPPTIEPVSLEEAKRQLRLGDEVDDAHVDSLVSAARRLIEQVCSRALVETVVEMQVAGFCDELRLAGGHLAATPGLTVKYLDAEENEQTLAPSRYRVIPRGEQMGLLIVAPGGDWPETAARPDAVRIRYTVGWRVVDENNNAVPEDVRMAVKMLLSMFYENRTADLNDPAVVTTNSAFDSLVNGYRFWEL